MSDRALLGPADLTDDAFATMVAASLGVDEAQVTSCDVEVVDYALEALTTAARYWVRGTARHDGGTSHYAFFVKVVQSWTRSPAFQFVPESQRELAAASLPWQTEPLVYRSDLADRLPAGLSMPQARVVLDVDDLSAAVWLEAVAVDRTPWDLTTFERAAYLLGRFAASASVRPLTALGNRDVVARYAHGRLAGQVLPALHSEELWRHPLVADAFGPDLRARLTTAATRVAAVVAELARAPLGAAHGDACPQNLLVAEGSPGEFVLIDYGFFCEAPLGFDLGQLLLGEMQLGRRPASELPALESACLPAYVDGLRAEGCDVPLEVVRRAHALLLLVFWGLSAVPLEVLFGAPASSPEVVRDRARAAAFVLDLVDGTDEI